MDVLRLEQIGGGLGPIERQQVAHQVALRLLDLVKSGELRVGEQLPPERVLAGQLEVSRSSLREALRALSLLGVVNIRHGGGVFVSSLSPEALLAPLDFFISLNTENMEALFEARMLIESALAGMAARAITPQQLGRLEGCLRASERAMGDAAQFIRIDVDFHHTIFEAADNVILVKIARGLHSLGRASREITGRLPGVPKRSYADHRKIFAALQARDESAARAAMEKHLVNVRRAYRARGG
ncbi:MAG: FadR family transcriptional regulator [Hyphomonadaceae bacterium]|nr:FadR family transcriptional regulator [Hyphomonadaceae bacterium]